MAQALAEKYEDFAFMVMICDKEKDSERLEKYKITFADKVVCRLRHYFMMFENTAVRAGNAAI